MSSLQERRLAAGFSQQALAELAGIRQATLSAIESGQTRPRKHTLAALAAALHTDIASISEALAQPTKEKIKPKTSWPFLAGLDHDLQQGLKQALINNWTHHSTALEGNTMSLGDTHFVINQGLTVSGKSFQEHGEIHGHAQAIDLISELWRNPHKLSINHIHELHQLIQTGTIRDIFKPIGKWKNEHNGTMAITSKGPPQWHDYPSPYAVPDLIQHWLDDFHSINKSLSKKTPTRKQLVRCFSDIHLGFTAIHPYADGNGRLARLLANIPVLFTGQPPIIIPTEKIQTYLQLMGDFSLHWQTPAIGTKLVPHNTWYRALNTFFDQCWELSLALVNDYQNKQKQRSRT